MSLEAKGKITAFTENRAARKLPPLPIITWDRDPKIQEMFATQSIGLGSVVAAGNMPEF